MLFQFDKFLLDADRRELRGGDGGVVHVEPQVFDLLLHLAQNANRVVSKDELIERVWNGRAVSDGALNSRINAARRAIGDSGERQAIIRTVQRRGFLLAAEVRTGASGAAAATRQHARAEGTLLGLALPDKPSIAVMPFENLSGDPAQDYFADGMVEDMITGLSRIKWLFVIARSSTFTYKGQPVDVKRVGRELGVRYVLEGSVGARVVLPALALDPDRLDPGRRDAEQDGAAVGLVAPDRIQSCVGLGQGLGHLFADEAAGQHCVHHLSGGAAAQRAGQRQDVTVGPLSRGRQDDRLRIGELRHRVGPLLQGPGPFQTLLPTRAAHPGWRGMRTRTLLSAELSSAFRIISLRSAGRRMIVPVGRPQPRAQPRRRRREGLEGIAFDIAMAKHDPAVFEEAARAVGFRGFGLYPRSGFIHIGLGTARSWGERFPKRATALAAETPPAREVLAENRTLKGSGAAGVATIGAAGVEVSQEVLAKTQRAILPLVPYLDTLRWVFIAAALTGIAVAVYARLDDWKRGRR